LDEYREEIEVLKAERDHLEKSNVDLRKKVSDFQSMQTPVSVINIECRQEFACKTVLPIHDNVD
jgi:hypothetical protein